MPSKRPEWHVAKRHYEKNEMKGEPIPSFVSDSVLHAVAGLKGWPLAIKQ
jgi:hypothetical protein